MYLLLHLWLCHFTVLVVCPLGWVVIPADRGLQPVRAKTTFNTSSVSYQNQVIANTLVLVCIRCFQIHAQLVLVACQFTPMCTAHLPLSTCCGHCPSTRWQLQNLSIDIVQWLSRINIENGIIVVIRKLISICSQLKLSTRQVILDLAEEESETILDWVISWGHTCVLIS